MGKLIQFILLSAQFLLEEKECQPSDSKGVLVVVEALIDLVSTELKFNHYQSLVQLFN